MHKVKRSAVQSARWDKVKRVEENAQVDTNSAEGNVAISHCERRSWSRSRTLPTGDVTATKSRGDAAAYV
jgi:hypothetical protein